MKLEIKHKEKNCTKHTHTHTHTEIEHVSKWVKEEVRRNKKYFETNENRNTTFQNLWDTANQYEEGCL